jgi:uncharacterized protein involved in outer membrane biogenesis
MLARLFVLIGGLFVLVLTAALVAPYFIDWTNYRADFEREASGILGLPVKVQGDASARILPFPSVTFTDVVVGAGDSEPAMTAEEFSMDAELAPFMSGEFRIFDMRVVRPKATVSVGADGTIDWAMRPSSPIAASRISLEKLTISEGLVTIHHAGSGRDHVLSEINMDASARSLLGPWRAEGSLRADGRQAALSISTGAPADDGSMRLKLRTNPALYPIVIEADGDVRMENSAATYAGTFRVDAKEDVTLELRGAEKNGAAAKADRQVVPPNRLGGKFTFDSHRLSIDEFRFESGPLNDPYVADGKAAIDFGAEPRFSIVADGAQLRFDETTQQATPGQALDRRLADLQAMLTGLPQPTIPGTVEVNLPAIVAGDTMIRDVRVSAEPQGDGWNIKSLAAVLPGRATVEANGALATAGELGFKGNLLLAVAQPSGFMAWLSKDVDEAIRRLPAAGFSADVDLSPRRQHFGNLELQLGAAKFRGEVDSRRPADARPTLLVRLDGGAVDFDGLSAFASLFVSEQGGNRFSGTDLDLAIKAGPVAIAGLQAESLDTAVRLREGTIEVDRLTVGGLAGATMTATGTLRDLATHAGGTIDASIVAVDLEPLIEALAQRFPDQPIVAALRERSAARAGLFADTEIDVVADATAGDDGKRVYSLNAKGVTGGTEFSGSYLGAIGDPEAEIVMSFGGKNADAASLLALYGVRTLPIDLVGAGETDITASGSWAKGLVATVKFSGDRATAGFEGTLSSAEQGIAAKGKAAVNASDIEPWLMTAGFGLPGMGTGTGVDLTADADYAGGLLVLSGLEGTVADGAVAGDVNLELKEGVPHLSGQMALDEIDLYPLARLILGDDTLESADSGWATTPFQQKSLAPFTADLDLNAGSLAAGPIATASDAQASLRLDADGLRVSDLTGELAGGKVGGLFELKNNDGSGLLTAQLRLTNADVSQIVPGIGLSGRGDFSTALSASGKTIEGVVAALSGSGTATLRDVVIPGINPDAFPAFIAEADRIGRDVDAAKTAAFAPVLAGQGEFAAGNIDVAFTVAGGVLRAPPVTASTPSATLSAEVRADLNDGKLAVTGTIAYAPGDEALVGSEPAVGFIASGAPGDVSVTFDSGPLAQFLTQRALEKEQARVEAMQSELLEKQRLRREVRYYAALQTARERLAEEKQRAEEDVRRKAEEAARIQAEEEAKRKAEEEAKARADEEARLATEAEARKAAEEKARRDAQAAERKKAQAAARAAQQSRDQPPQPEPPPLSIDRDAFDTSPATQPRKGPLGGLLDGIFGN